MPVSYKEVPLSQGLAALVSPEDYEMVSQFTWCACKNGPRFYARRSDYSAGKGVTVSMHRMIMNPPDGCVVDHIDGNGLNNQRSNLRIATNLENSWNQRKRSDSTSGFKGVYWDKQNASWRAMIKVHGKRKHIGRFVDVQEAAKAYDRNAKEYFGEFAALNFPEV